jgi:AAA domain
MDSKSLTRSLNATNFWMGVECLSPNSPPELGENTATGTITWDIHSDDQLPWVDPRKKAQLAQKERQSSEKFGGEMTSRFVAYCSLIPMPQVTEEIRARLGATKNELSDYRDGDPAAVLALLLDRSGRVTGAPFISCMPWAMGQLKISKPDQALNFNGFFGQGGFEETLGKKLMQHMSDCRILAKSDSSMSPSAVLSTTPNGDVDANAESESQPLTVRDVRELFELVFSGAGWKPQTIESELRILAKQISVKKADKTPDDTDMLNSFYVEDIAEVSLAMQQGRLGEALTAFMSGTVPDARTDIRSPGDTTVARGVQPKEMPLACWPSEHGLVLGQQFAVNSIRQKLRDEAGIFSVNGPPGTGKTTLLRDVIASVVLDRAMALEKFTDPLNAFTTEIKVEGWRYGQVWQLDPTVAGKSIVVASANNGAVENLTKELPSRAALPKTSTLNYFADLSDSIAADRKAKSRKVGSTWGVMAAALGNKQNRTDFFQRFCWPKNVQEKELQLPNRLMSLWEVVGSDHIAKPWEEARALFSQALKKACSAQNEMQQIADTLQALQLSGLALARSEKDVTALSAQMNSLLEQQPLLLARSEEMGQACQLLEIQHEASARRSETRSKLSEITDALSHAEPGHSPEALKRHETDLAEAEEETRRAEVVLKSTTSSQPNWLRVLFNGRLIKDWDDKFTSATADFQACGKNEKQKRDAYRLAAERTALLHELTTAKEAAKLNLDRAASHCQQLDLGPQDEHLIGKSQLQAAIAARRQAVEALSNNKQTIDSTTAAKGKASVQVAAHQADIRQQQQLLSGLNVTVDMARVWMNEGLTDEEIQLAVPWQNHAFFVARQELFAAAMDLHASFIVASWSKLKNTLAVLEAVNSGTVSRPTVIGGVAQLWEALFLVVPVVSTTFASFPRMFQGWGSESIGWLLIDEAGQATPQQAIGAIWRAKRVVVVGDPLQLEPIVSLPVEALEPLRLRCKAELVYSPLISSTQVLADMANRIGTLIGQGDDQKWVGSPLRVHRRCLHKMFEVANAIAYDGMMVYGTANDQRNLWFGESCWIDVAANDPDGNSIPGQVNLALALVDDFVQAYGLRTDEKLNLYIITPFRDVDAAVGSGLFQFLRKDKDGMHGTIHTFQGKEADVVLIVLGGDPAKPGLIPFFAAAKPNLLNVAVTRAKKRIYVVGDHAQWSRHKYFSTLADVLPLREAKDIRLIMPPAAAVR